VHRQLDGAPEIFPAVRGRKTEVLIDAGAKDIAIEHGGKDSGAEEMLLQRLGQGGLSRAGKSGHPNHRSAMAEQGGPSGRCCSRKGRGRLLRRRGVDHAASGDSPAAHEYKSAERGDLAARVDRNRAPDPEADLGHFVPFDLGDAAAVAFERDGVERALDAEQTGFRLLGAKPQRSYLSHSQRLGVKPKNAGGEHPRLGRRLIGRGADLATLDEEFVLQSEGDAAAGFDRSGESHALGRPRPGFDRFYPAALASGAEFDRVPQVHLVDRDHDLFHAQERKEVTVAAGLFAQPSRGDRAARRRRRWPRR
jgi:hypothetical protein